MFLFVDLALVFNQYVTPTALTNIGWKYYMIYVRTKAAFHYRSVLTLKSASGSVSSSLLYGNSILKRAIRH